MVVNLNLPKTTNTIALLDFEFDNQEFISYQFAAIKLKRVDSTSNLFQVVESINLYCKDVDEKILSPFLKNKGLSTAEYNHQIRNFLADVDTIAAHYLRMDNEFVQEITNQKFQKLCTYELARKVLGRNNNLSLPTIAKECMYSLPEYEQHNAYNDVRALLWVISYLTNKDTKGVVYEILKSNN